MTAKSVSQLIRLETSREMDIFFLRISCIHRLHINPPPPPCRKHAVGQGLVCVKCKLDWLKVRFGLQGSCYRIRSSDYVLGVREEVTRWRRPFNPPQATTTTTTTKNTQKSSVTYLLSVSHVSVKFQTCPMFLFCFVLFLFFGCLSLHAV